LDPRFRDSIFSKETKEGKGISFFTSLLRKSMRRREERKNFVNEERL